jgi:hypothetical protein
MYASFEEKQELMLITFLRHETKSYGKAKVKTTLLVLVYSLVGKSVGTGNTDVNITFASSSPHVTYSCKYSFKLCSCILKYVNRYSKENV